MAKKRLSTEIPREWTSYTAETIQREFERVYSEIQAASPALATFGSLTPHPNDLIKGDQAGTGGWTNVSFDATAQRVLTNDGSSPSWTQVDLTKGVTGTLPATSGGTSVATVAVGDLLYGSATNVWSKLAKDANATRYLSNTGASNIPAWAQVNLANGVTGVLPTTNGGTGLNAFAQGDLIYGSATNVLAALAKDANATRYLSNTGATNNPAWAQIDLSNGVTGTLGDAHLSANVPLLNASLNNFANNLRAAKVGIGVTPSASVFAAVGLPTSSAGLATGDVWVDTGAANVLKVV